MPATAADMPLHPLRAQVLAEVHARPFQRMTTPRRVHWYAFAGPSSAAAGERAALSRWCVDTGAPPPADGAAFHTASFADARLRWERHSEFSTYGWDVPAMAGAPFAYPLDRPSPIGAALPPPGAVLVAVDLALISAAEAPTDLSALFDDASICVSSVHGGGAVIATDFRQNEQGFVRILIVDHGLTPTLAGTLVQRLLEIETYRTFALLGLPEAQRLSPIIARVEQELVALSARMRVTKGLEDNGQLLDTLVLLAAELEAEAASSSFRFGATRAYDALVQARLGLLGEQPLAGTATFAAFLDRRMAPAMRTCQSSVDRQTDLSKKLERAANLLRTRVDIEMERQNRALLESMSESTTAQLRLQQTVEGLSIAAVTYYVLSLIYYAMRGAHDGGFWSINPNVGVLIAMPAVLAAVGWTMWRLKRRPNSR